MLSWVINSLPKRNQRLAAEQADSLELFFGAGGFKALPDSVNATVNARPTCRGYCWLGDNASRTAGKCVRRRLKELDKILPARTVCR